MSAVWWGRESSAALRTPQPPRRAGTPLLMPADRASLLTELDGRAGAFTPEWTNRNPAEDAGAALRQLFGEQMEPVVQRFDRWPDKAFTEYLNIAGISPLPGVPAEALLEFEVADDPPQSFLPFGDGRTAGAALLIGLTGENAPSQTLTLGIGIASPPDAPPPVGAGGVVPLSVPSGPALVWEAFDGGNVVALEVVRDETGGLIRSGLVELALPQRWREGGPAGLPKAKSRRWLRLRLSYGRFTVSPTLSFVKVNVVRALGARTIRDEILEPVPASNGRRMRVTQTQ